MEGCNDEESRHLTTRENTNRSTRTLPTTISILVRPITNKTPATAGSVAHVSTK